MKAVEVDYTKDGRVVFTIDVGQLSPEEASHYVKKIVGKFHDRKKSDDEGSN